MTAVPDDDRGHTLEGQRPGRATSRNAGDRSTVQATVTVRAGVRYELALWGALLTIAAAFSAVFFASVLPALLPITNFAQVALLDGFVNPTARGYTLDTIATALALFAWILHERLARGVRYGWVAVLVSFAPGVVVGLVAYLLIRRASLRE